jgi:hypothetical protein
MRSALALTVAAGRAVPLPAGGAWPAPELVQFAAAGDLQLGSLVVVGSYWFTARRGSRCCLAVLLCAASVSSPKPPGGIRPTTLISVAAGWMKRDMLARCAAPS